MQDQDPAKIKMGKLEGTKDKTIQGTIVLAIDPDAGEVVFFKDIQMGDVSALKVYLAANRDLERSICLGELKQTSGSFRMSVPFGMDTTPYNTVVIQDKKSERDIAFAQL